LHVELSCAVLREFQCPALDVNGVRCERTLSFNILPVTYDVLVKDMRFLEPYAWQVLVVGEEHPLKNAQGKKNLAMASLRTRHRIILTGTPIQNSLLELWTLLRFVSPREFADAPAFLESDVDGLDDATVLALRDRISPHLLRRSVAGVEHTIAAKRSA
jgi:SNF2 family DNA or RNA helicase